MGGKPTTLLSGQRRYSRSTDSSMLPSREMLPTKRKSKIPTMLVFCVTCLKQFDKSAGAVKRNAAKGYNNYCSEICRDNNRRTGKKTPGWHGLRFTPNELKIEIVCSECGISFWLPPSKINNNLRCSDACNLSWRAKQKDALKRYCLKCGKEFYVRTAQIKAGAGKFCSRACTRGDYKRATWKIKKGWVRKLGDLQNWKCAICRKNLKKGGYDLDHILPFALGGLHIERNTQLTCSRCNRQKGARDPIEFMRSRGHLL